MRDERKQIMQKIRFQNLIELPFKFENLDKCIMQGKILK